LFIDHIPYTIPQENTEFKDLRKKLKALNDRDESFKSLHFALAS
jgi:hypothetical protein